MRSGSSYEAYRTRTKTNGAAGARERREHTTRKNKRYFVTPTLRIHVVRIIANDEKYFGILKK